MGQSGQVKPEKMSPSLEAAGGRGPGWLRRLCAAPLAAAVALATIPAMLTGADKEEDDGDSALAEVPPVPEGGAVITLGAGCFWCVEAVLEQQEGVVAVTSGYMGGHVENPTYRAVCEGTTGHAEVVRVVYDPEKLSTQNLLKWFWKLHDPTQLNRQGNDIGTQYRSAIFYHTDEQRDIAAKSKAEAQASGEHRGPIVTEVTKAGVFYPAEKYHQEYYRNNKEQGYCRFVILPKLEKLGLEK
jgi:peptide-methionine (S)-S-oxide reductase